MDVIKIQVFLVIMLSLVLLSYGYRMMSDPDMLTEGVKRGEGTPFVGSLADREGDGFEQNYPGHNVFMKQLINYLDYVGKRK